MEDAYKDLKLLCEGEGHKRLKTVEERQCVQTDFECLSALRAAALNTKGELAAYRRAVAVLNGLISQEMHPHCDLVPPLPEEKPGLNSRLANSKGSQKTRTSNTSASLAGTQPSMTGMSSGPAIDVGIEDKPSNYKENVFNLEDYYLYRGVMQFYCRSYKQAITDLEESVRIKSEQKSLTLAKELEEDSENASIDTDLSDVGLCAVNVNEYKYNIILCHILVLCSLTFSLAISNSPSRSATL
jgi:hypothetical protein